MDCPISKHKNNNFDSNFIIAVHNPASIAMNYSRIQLPHTLYDIYTFNTETSEFEAAIAASAVCEDILLETQETIHNCDMYVDYTIPAF